MRKTTLGLVALLALAEAAHAAGPTGEQEPEIFSATPSPTVSATAPATALPRDPVSLHKQAALRLGIIVEELFAEIGRDVRAGRNFSEKDARAFVEKRFTRDGLVSSEPPVIAVGKHAGDANYADASDAPIKRGDLVLVSLAAKRKDTPGAIYADITWVAWAGKSREIPPKIAKLWPIVRSARDAAADHLRARVEARAKVTGEEIDLVARNIVRKDPHGPWTSYPHATGHSLGEDDHGSGPNFQDGEARVIDSGCFTVEPGIYLPDDGGVRSGIDICVTSSSAAITTGISQREIRGLLD